MRNLIIERTKNDRTRKTGTRIQGIRRLSQQWDVRTRPWDSSRQDRGQNSKEKCAKRHRTEE